MTGSETRGFEAAMRERIAELEADGRLLVIADPHGASIANTVAGAANTSIQVVEQPVTTARIMDLLSRADLRPPPRLPGWMRDRPELEPAPLPARHGWVLERAA